MRRARAPQVLALNGKWLAQAVTGTQRYAQEVTRRLVDSHDGPVVLHVPADAAVPEWLEARVRVRRSRLRGNAFEQLALPLAARSQLLLSLGGPAPLLARKQVVTMHDATPFRFPKTYSVLFGSWYRLMYRRLANHALGLITVSEFSASELATVLDVPVERFVVAGNGVEHVDDLDDRRPPVPTGPFVLCVGTLARHKNLGAVLSALDRAAVRTFVVGAAGSRKIFEAEQRSPLEHATLLGRVSDEEVVWLYRNATCLVFPSLYEGFGLPIIEAQRLGCPVVSSDRASLPEVAGEGALFVDASSPEQVVAAVRRVISNSALREDLVDRGLVNADRHRWADTATRVRLLVERFLA